MKFPSKIFFIDINHGYRTTVLKKRFFWLLPFYMAVGTYCHYEKVRRTMRTAIVSYVLNWGSSFWLTLFWGCFLEFLSIIIITVILGVVFDLEIPSWLLLDTKLIFTFCFPFYIFSYCVAWKSFQFRVSRTLLLREIIYFVLNV